MSEKKKVSAVPNEPAKERKEKSAADRELWAMGAVTRAMKGLKPNAQRRVMDWAQARFPEADDIVLAPTPAPSGEVHPAMDND